MSYQNLLIKLLSQADLTNVVSDSLVYEGYFKPGKSAYDEPVCKIIRRQLVNNVWSVMYADGNDNYDNIWDNRADLDYSHKS
jgi:hypothetical protein